jgi:hypothetical protein
VSFALHYIMYNVSVLKKLYYIYKVCDIKPSVHTQSALGTSLKSENIKISYITNIRVKKTRTRIICNTMLTD